MVKYAGNPDQRRHDTLTRNRQYNALKNNAKILLMEDEEILRKTFSRLLQHIGYDVESVRNGNEAIEHYQKAAELSHPFDIIIVDLTIKDGMGGIETLEALRKINPHLKSVLISGYVSDPVVINFRDYGFSEVLNKPFEIDQLREILTRLLDQDS